MDYYLMIFILVTSLLLSSHGIRIRKVENDSSVFNVLDYGAIGDGTHDDTQVVSQAWQKVCTASSDTPTLVFPQGKTFLLKPISFKGPCNATSIHIQIQGNIVAPNSISEWGKCEGNNWLNFAYVDNLIIDGQGEIDGRGSIWWSNNYEDIATVYDASSCYRPTALCFASCQGLQLKGLTHKNSPGSHIRMGGCNNSTLSNLNIIAPEDSPNTDGIDVSFTTNLTILDSVIGTGDDCIAIGSDTQWINITNIACGPGHGISVGSLGVNGSQATVENIHVRNCSFSKTQNGARIKTWQGGSGYARKITYEDIVLTDVNNPIIIDQFYCITKGHNCPPQLSAVAVSDVSFSGFQGTSSSKAAITLNCSQATPCTEIVLQNINVAAFDPSTGVTSFCEHASDVQANSVVPSLNCSK